MLSTSQGREGPSCPLILDPASLSLIARAARAPRRRLIRGREADQGRLPGLKLLIDLRCLETASAGRGIGRYARELALAMREALPEGFSSFALSWSGVGKELGLGDVLYRGPRQGIGFADRYLLPALFRREAVDLYHSPAYALPSRRCRDTALVLTIHDLVADVHPGGLSWRHRAAFRRTFRSGTAAHRVITVSRRTREDLLARYPIEPWRVVVVPNGVAGAFHAIASGESPPWRFPAPFLLYVGGLDPLKNVSLLLRVLRRCRERGRSLYLVVVGEEGPRREALIEEARTQGVADALHATGRLGDAALAAAYRGALAFVFPSRYEGFGLPPLEAMAAGCPVIASPAGALAETLDDGAILVPPDDLDGWAGAVLDLAADEEGRRRIAAAGRAWAASFTWERTARETMQVYLSALREVGKA